MNELDDSSDESINDLKEKENNDNYYNICLDNNCDLILNELNDIFDKLKEYYNSSSEEISNYIFFMNSFSSQIEQINTIFKDSNKKLNSNIYNNSLFNLFNNYNLLLSEKFFDLSSQLQRSIISPIEIYKEKNELENNTILNRIKKLKEKTESENNYLKEIKKDIEIEKKNYENEKDEDIKTKSKEKMEEKIELYKLKINEINLYLLDCKNELNNIMKEIINKQVANNESIKMSINNYFDIMGNFFIKSTDDTNALKTRINDIVESLKNIKFINNISFKVEQIQWEINNKNDGNEKNKINKSHYSNNNQKSDYDNYDNNISNSNYFKDEKKKISLTKNINNLISNLFKKESLPENEAAEFLFLFSEENINIDIYDYLCKCFYQYEKYKRNTIKEFLNFNNFTHFSNVLNLIIENLSNNNILKEQYNKYLLLDKIINIGEESIYENTFICSLLSNNNKLKNYSLWSNSIKYKLISELKNICENHFSTSKSKINKLEGLKKQIFEKFKNKEKKMKVNKDEDLIIKKGYYKFIPHYKDLDPKIKDNICKKELPKLIHEILKKYICHMANYNYSLEETYKLIESIFYEYFSTKEPELMNFYINYSIASTFAIRRMIPISNLKKKSNSEEIKMKIKDIKIHKYLYGNKKYFSLDYINNKYLIIKNVFIFLENSEKMKLINLNKYLYELLRKDIYHYILLHLKNHSFSINEHIQIWKCYLKCSSLYKKVGLESVTYESIIKDIASNKDFLNDFKKDISTIELDIPRSPFKLDPEASSKAIKNILYSFLYINNHKNKSINYYQGMNYITTFLYEMIHKEEDCLLLLSGLFYHTEYSEIFSDKMDKIQKYLYVVERLVYLYLPKTYSHLRDNNLELNFFVNPIFISLFTNIYSSLPENDFSFLLHIWDDFILNGWKTIFTDILTILKQNENKIIKFDNDDLEKYLSHGIKNGEMFTVYNYDEFKKEKNKFKPTNQLLEIISKESSLEEELKK